MKTARKVLVLARCAVLLVSATIMGTMAYLTSRDTVTNTFTVGKVAITLDEKDEDNSTAGQDRDKSNSYHLLPGTLVNKDPVVHVEANSEDSFIFVKVENNISAIIAKTAEGKDAVEAQILANGWTALENNAGVYYKSYTKTASVTDLKVFESFTIDNSVSNTTLATYEGETIVVTAYAIQSQGMTDAAAAWSTVSTAA